MKRILGLWGVIFSILAISGCDADGEGAPRIVGNVTQAVMQPVTSMPGGNQTADFSEPADKNIPWSWYPPRSREKGWKAIVIHHSATQKGNAEDFDEYHKNGHHWKGIGYDFVIGNGNGSSDGSVEVTFRWEQQIAGAHVGDTPGNWANEDAVGICLVGDFTKTHPTPRQMDALVKLIHFLQRRYRIPESRIYGHSDTPGYKGRTLCPGKNFSMYRLKQML
jgi:N-acetyl-anhydromuramyl-L-alanine amidase AmpD